MLSTTQLQMVKNVASSLVLLGEMFTKYDVTTILRKENAQTVTHHEVRGEIDQLLANGFLPSDYSITNTQLPNGAWAQVIHPNFKDPTTYDPTIFTNGKSGIDATIDPTTSTSGGGTAVATTPATTVTAPTPVVTTPIQTKTSPRTHTTDANGNDVYTVSSVDKGGRLCVPNALVRKLSKTGVPAGGKVFVGTNANGTITIAASPSIASALSGNTVTHDYVVDKDQNVRLQPVVLREAGLDVTAGFTVTGGVTAITVTTIKP